MEDKLIPNREALRVLRRQGKVAWSQTATRALVTVAVLAYIMSFGAHYAEEVWGAFQAMQAARASDQDLAWVLMRGVGVLVVTTSLLAVTVGILVSLVQTGLLVSIHLVRPAFRRSSDPPRASWLSRALPIFGGFLGGWLLFRYIRDVLLIFRQPQDRVLSSIARVAGDLGKTVIVVALVFAILALVFARLSFLWRHRMTKREMIGQLQK
jgi:flagellar biosynthesis protein FlhB